MDVSTLAEQLMFSTVRIEASGAAGTSVGTGFVFGYSLDELRQTKEGRWGFFMVTNKHVVEDANEGSFVFLRAKHGGSPDLGQGIKVPIMQFRDGWHGHPNDDIDIAVMPLQPLLNEIRNQGLATFVSPVLRGHVPPMDAIAEMDAVEEVFFIGYPNGLYDEHNLTPIIRRGTTATSLQLDYGGRPTFLVDASVFPGSSGSPIFVADVASYKDKRGNVVMGAKRRWFLGVVSATFFIQESGQVDVEPVPTTQRLSIRTRQMIDLGLAYKSSTVVETIEDLYARTGRR